MLIYLLGLCIGVYAAALLCATFAWVRLPDTSAEKYPPEAYLLPITVVVAARNEQENLPNLLACLEKQTHRNFELRITDDHSDDHTLPLLKEAQKNSAVRLFFSTLGEGKTGKKAAISAAVSEATGKLIVTTDADCQMSADWLVCIAAHYLKSGAKLLSAPVCFSDEKNIFERLQTLEFVALAGIGAAGIALKKPALCNAANLAYPKAVFEEVRGYENTAHCASGDDVFLLDAVNKKYPEKIIFIKSEAAIVRTYPQRGAKAFFEQRKRWAGKWNAQGKNLQLFIALGIFLMYFFWILALFCTILGLCAWKSFLALCVLKYLSEHIFLNSLLRFFRRRKLRIFIPVLFVVYPFYAFFFGLRVQKTGYTWKGRRQER